MDMSLRDCDVKEPYVEPRGALEVAVAEVWRDTFKIERLSRNANFFELGGDSLRGLELMDRVAERFEMELPVVMLYQNPTPRQMAQQIQSLRYDSSHSLREQQTAAEDIEFLLGLPNEHTGPLLKNLRRSQSQYRQDLFALSETEFKRGGFFVEFGAAHGVRLSNTYLLEKEFGWSGILAEPARCWHESLAENREVPIETRCVWSRSGELLTFNEVSVAELSTLSSFSGSDAHEETRRVGTAYEVETVSLVDLLIKYNAPQQIDYLSIDTEGSELEILRAFDFQRYLVKVITCEHNFTPIREEIHSLLSQQGYVRKFRELSKVDDWYVKV